MAISIYSNNGVKNYGIKHYIVETDDFEALDKLSRGDLWVENLIQY
jgi:hypothetical protein